VAASAFLAGLAAFLLTRSSSPHIAASSRASRAMDDSIEAVEAVRAVAEGNQQFSRAVWAAVGEKEGGNLAVSPYSLSAVMAMLAEGASGPTLEQIQAGLSFPTAASRQAGYRETIPALRTNENFTLESASQVFVMENFQLLPEFVQNLHQNYHAGVQTVNFAESVAASKTINNWVADLTRDKIDNLVSEDMLNSMTRLVLANALYFKGDWATKFDAKRTKTAQFYNGDGEVEVEMMQLERKFYWAAVSSLDCAVLELPYKGDRIVMQILLPNQRTAGLADLESKLQSVDLQKLFDEEKFNTKVNVKLPKFKISKSLSLAEPMAELGMKDMFTGKADFSGIDGSKKLYVSAIVQKVFVEVNEEGSEAAAATGAVMMMRSMPLPPEQFLADHPFLFQIRDKLTGMLLFQGRVVDPTITK